MRYLHVHFRCNDAYTPHWAAFFPLSTTILYTHCLGEPLDATPRLTKPPCTGGNSQRREHAFDGPYSDSQNCGTLYHKGCVLSDLS